jgi:hypothetical protein
MNKKRIVLSLSVFMVAIGGAFASALLVPGSGYTHISQVPQQNMTCKFRKNCDGGQFVCRASFVESGVVYNNIPLRRPATTCNIQDLTQSVQ